MLTWKYIGVLNIKGKHNFKHFYYIHIVEIPTQKGEHSWKRIELSLNRKKREWPERMRRKRYQWPRVFIQAYICKEHTDPSWIISIQYTFLFLPHT